MKHAHSTVVLLAVLIGLSSLSLTLGATDLNWQVLMISRLPRLMAILCTGMGMSVAGLLMQQLCRNKFVSPTTGATIASSQLGLLVAMLAFNGGTIFQRTTFAFVAALLGTYAFIALTQRIQYKDIVLVPLVGIMFGNIISGVTNFIAYRFDLQQAIATKMSGDFSMILKGRYEIVYLVVPLIFITFIYANHFNIVGMGQKFATNLGLNFNTVMLLGISIAALITASIVTIVGSISYIGLIIPNLVTMLKGDRIQHNLIDTALLGALFVLVCDMLGRVINAPYEVPIAMMTGVIGSLVFVGLMVKQLRGGRSNG
jgi:iron complex transport system permease protein